jgi:hypothetical protein
MCADATTGADEVERYALLSLVASGLRIGISRRSVVKREATVLTKQNNVSVRSANSFQHHQPTSLTNSANLAGLIFTFQAFVSNIFA